MTALGRNISLLLLLFLAGNVGFSFAQTDAGFPPWSRTETVREPNEVGGPPLEYWQLIMMGENGKEPVYKHPKKIRYEDHNSFSFEVGKMTWADGYFVFLTYWNFWGETTVEPRGGMIRYMKMNDEGKFVTEKASIYIEEGNPADGREFLHRNPKTEEEQALYRNYIRKKQDEYKATFVFGAEADSLMETVRNGLKKEINAEWGIE